MKWHTKQQKLKKLYDDNYNIYHEKNLYPVNLERTITQFLFLPITLSGERRWLELVRIKQELNLVSDHDAPRPHELGYFYYKWLNISFEEQK